MPVIVGMKDFYGTDAPLCYMVGILGYYYSGNACHEWNI
jgi:hypothetical protein